VALPRDAEADGSAVAHVLGAAEPSGGAVRGGATQRVPWQHSVAESRHEPPDQVRDGPGQAPATDDTSRQATDRR